MTTTSFSAAAAIQRAHCLRLAAADPGWHPYIEDQAQRLEAEDPRLFAGLHAEVLRITGGPTPFDSQRQRRATTNRRTHVRA